MKRILPILILLCCARAFAAGGTCPTQFYSIQGNAGTLTSLGVTNGCYFVDSTAGSDSNDGLSEASGHPWAHAPGMQGCTGNCSSATISAGTGIILKGGSSWGASSLGWLWSKSGSSFHPNYVGWDINWYDSTACGGLWCRPILDFGGSAAASGNYYIFLNNGSTAIWTTFDNIEEKGWNCSAMETGDMNETISPNGEFEENYTHGWSYTYPDSTCQVFAYSSNTSDGAAQVAGNSAHDNVIDGSDQTPSAASHSLIPVGCVLHFHDFHHNICNYVYNVNGLFDLIYGNVFSNFYAGNSGDHCNMANFAGILTSGSQGLAYNNVFSSMQCSGGLILWLSGNSVSASSVYLAFGNVFFGVDSGSTQIITTCTHPNGTNCGIYYVFGNTAQGGSSQQLMGNGETPQRGQVYSANNHLIGNITLSQTTGVYVFDEGNELIQTLSTANGQGYTSAETYAFSPISTCTSGTCSTVQAGQNVGSNLSGWCAGNNPLSLSCPTVTFTGNLAAALSDTTYASENTSNHTVTLRSVNSRGTTWDIGAYQFVQTITGTSTFSGTWTVSGTVTFP